MPTVYLSDKIFPKISAMVDEGKIAFTIAVELSYLKEDEQYGFIGDGLEQCTPSSFTGKPNETLSQSED